MFQTCVLYKGVVGEHLHDTSQPTRMFISDDAGRNWYSVSFACIQLGFLLCNNFYSHYLQANTLMLLVTMEIYYMLSNAQLILQTSGIHPILCGVYYIVKYRVSHDRGKCFQKFPLDTTGHFVLRGLVGDFNVGSLVGLAFGVPTHANNTSEWMIHAIKFSSALDRPCE